MYASCRPIDSRKKNTQRRARSKTSPNNSFSFSFTGKNMCLSFAPQSYSAGICWDFGLYKHLSKPWMHESKANKPFRFQLLFRFAYIVHEPLVFFLFNKLALVDLLTKGIRKKPHQPEQQQPKKEIGRDDDTLTDFSYEHSFWLRYESLGFFLSFAVIYWLLLCSQSVIQNPQEILVSF